MLSQREAARRIGHDPKALRQAIADHVLASLKGGIEEAELARFVDWLGTCRHPQCEKPARYPSFCCCRRHAVTEAKRTIAARECAHPDCNIIFTPRPEQLRLGQGECCSREHAQRLRRMREHAAGRLRGELVECACGCGERRRVFPSQRTAPPGSPAGYVASYRFVRGHWARHRWAHGIGLKNNVRGFYRSGRWTLAKLRAQHGLWASQKPNARRPRLDEIDRDFARKAAEAIRLKNAHPAWGTRTIGEMVGLSRFQVRELLASLNAS
jgi:hypothetical protein